ncbi:uncharacterized protein LOC133295380 [Gastrolobium bilobum]|uniref:uncharacterized protein LOC133295380 n=1 Tax=Gastrolobium bilobum TaxID=150636 RepID=UPI002AB0F679|nr:uncharacterized protein LOC133295380 [Gastrolobium bilobum]
MARLFLEKFFPSSRATSIRKEVSGIRQANGENIHEYWERFKRLCASCPHHQIPEQLLIVYFYKCLLPMDINLLDAASGGVLVNKTPVAAKELIAQMTANAQQFGARANNSAVFQVQASLVQNSVVVVAAMTLSTDNQRKENKLDELTSLVIQLAVTIIVQPPAPQASNPCGICCTPLMPAPVYKKKDHPNLKWNQNQNQNQYQQRQHFVPQQQRHNFQPTAPPQQPPAPQQPSSGLSLEDLLKQLATSNMQLQQRIESSIQNLQTQIRQLATSVSQTQPQGPSSLPSQTVPNSKGNVSAITLRSGKQLEDPKLATGKAESSSDQSKNKEASKQGEDESEPAIPLPFPQRVVLSKKLAEKAQEKEILDTFRKVELNIPLLDAI